MEKLSPSPEQVKLPSEHDGDGEEEGTVAGVETALCSVDGSPVTRGELAFDDVVDTTGDDAGGLTLEVAAGGDLLSLAGVVSDPPAAAFADSVTKLLSAATMSFGQLASWRSAAEGVLPAHVPPYSTLEPGFGKTTSLPCDESMYTRFIVFSITSPDRTLQARA